MRRQGPGPRPRGRRPLPQRRRGRAAVGLAQAAEDRRWRIEDSEHGPRDRLSSILYLQFLICPSPSLMAPGPRIFRLATLLPLAALAGCFGKPNQANIDLRKEIQRLQEQV